HARAAKHTIFITSGSSNRRGATLASLCGLDHAIVTQQRVDLRLAAAEGDERLERRPAAADAEYLVPEAPARFGIEHAVLLEQAVGVGGEHFGPLVAVVTRRITACEYMREVVRKAVVRGRNHHGHALAHA